MERGLQVHLTIEKIQKNELFGTSIPRQSNVENLVLAPLHFQEFYQGFHLSYHKHFSDFLLVCQFDFCDLGGGREFLDFLIFRHYRLMRCQDFMGIVALQKNLFYNICQEIMQQEFRERVVRVIRGFAWRLVILE